MLRYCKNICVGLCVFLMGFSGSIGVAQTTSSPTLDIQTLINEANLQQDNEEVDPEAVRRAIEQMNQRVKDETSKNVNSKPIFDGKNMIFNVNGVTYTFDITEGARKTSQALTSFVMTPQTPRAHQEVTIRVNNFSTDTTEDRITWSVNDTIVQDQIGGTSIKIRMGEVGESVHVVATILSRKLGEVFSKDITLTPGDVAVLWEANTYTPPFYKGKPLPSYRSTIKLIPFPTMLIDGRLIPPKDLLYQWSRNYQNIPSISGYGKQYSFIEASGGTREELLTLTVKDLESKAETERSVAISIVEPKILLYSGSPLQGTRYEQALNKSFTLGTQETTIKGEPFFISNEEIEEGSSPLKWKQNGKEIPSLYGSVTLQKPSTTGSSRIDASLENPKRILQFAQTGITISYQGN